MPKWVQPAAVAEEAEAEVSMSPGGARKGAGRARLPKPPPEAVIRGKGRKATPTGLGPGDQRKVITLREAADYLKCHYSTVYRMVEHGGLPGFKLGGDWRFLRSAMDEWIAKRQVSPAENTASKPDRRRRKPAEKAARAKQARQRQPK